MRYVSSIPPVVTSSDTPLVHGVTAVHAVKPVQSSSAVQPGVGQSTVRQQALRSREQVEGISKPLEDRRKICRRLSQQHVLIELRSNIDRRRNNLLGDFLVEHIDEKA